MSNTNTKTVFLKHGIPMGDKCLKKITLREPVLADMLAAEGNGNIATQPIRYRVALLSEVICSADDFQGPFTVGMLSKLKPNDYYALSQTLGDVEDAGEEQPGAEKAS